MGGVISVLRIFSKRNFAFPLVFPVLKPITFVMSADAWVKENLTTDADEGRLREELGGQPLTLLKQFVSETDWDLQTEDKLCKVYMKTVTIDGKKRQAYKTVAEYNLPVLRLVKVFGPGIYGSSKWNTSIKTIAPTKKFDVTSSTIQEGHDLGGGVISGRTMMVNQTVFSEGEESWLPLVSAKGWEGAKLAKGQVEMIIYPGSGSHLGPVAGNPEKTLQTWVMVPDPQLRFVPNLVLKRVLTSTFATFIADISNHIATPDGSF